MFMFIVYVFILFIASIGCGSFIKKDSKLFPLRSIIGFCAYLGITQLVYYPLQYFKVSSTVMNIVTFLMLSFAFVYGLFKMKKEDFKFLKSYEFWIILIAVFLITKIIPGVDAGDDSFYMSLFKDNANIGSINKIDPRVGSVGIIDPVYLYQGFYVLMSFLYFVQDLLFKGDISNIFISFRTTMSLFAVIFSSIIFVYVKDNLKTKKNSKIFYFVELLAFFLVAVLEWTHIYWGSFMIFQIFVPLEMILFTLYLKDKEKYKYILLIVNLGTLSLASSMLFLFAIIAFGYFAYEIFITKKAKCMDYLLMLLPSFVYAVFVFDKFILVPLILLVIILMYKNYEQLDKFINKYVKYVVVVLPLIFTVLSYILYQGFSIETYRVSKVTLLYNVVISLYSIYLIVKKEKINPSIFAFMIVVFIFFNPLTEPFVSHFMTSTHVYYRLFYITRNPFIVTVVFLSIYETCIKHKFKKYLKPLFICGMCLLLANYGKNFLSSTVLLDDYNIKYDYLLREDYYSKELGKEVSKLPDNSNIFSIYFAPRMYKDELVTTVARYPEKHEWRWNAIVRVLYGTDELTESLYGYFIKEIKDNHYDYIITYNIKEKRARYSNELFDIMYENDMFVLIKVKEDLWER